MRILVCALVTLMALQSRAAADTSKAWAAARDNLPAQARAVGAIDVAAIVKSALYQAWIGQKGAFAKTAVPAQLAKVDTKAAAWGAIALDRPLDDEELPIVTASGAMTMSKGTVAGAFRGTFADAKAAGKTHAMMQKGLASELSGKATPEPLKRVLKAVGLSLKGTEVALTGSVSEADFIEGMLAAMTPRSSAMPMSVSPMPVSPDQAGPNVVRTMASSARTAPSLSPGEAMKTVQMNAAEIAERTARFDALQPMSTMKDNDRVAQAAKDIIFARTILPIVLERTANPFGDAAAIFGAGGLTMNITVCPPGQGPGLHCHHNTFETFFVLEGAFELHLGDRGEERVRLNRWDTFSCPPGVCRAFVNVHDQDSVLLVVITGEVNARDDVTLPPIMAERLEAIQPGVLPEFQALGLAFTAGVADDHSA